MRSLRFSRLAPLALLPAAASFLLGGCGGTGGTSGTGGTAATAGTGGHTSSSTGSTSTTGSGGGAPGCSDPCTTTGESRCAGNWVQTCAQVGACRTWVVAGACQGNTVCDSAGTKCITPASACSSDAQCGCGCACGGGACHCTGAIPPTCNADAECGPPCSGLLCVSHQCEHKVCVPGMDQTCNTHPGMNAFAGTCDPNGVCTCKAGFTKSGAGTCG